MVLKGIGHVIAVWMDPVAIIVREGGIFVECVQKTPQGHGPRKLKKFHRKCKDSGVGTSSGDSPPGLLSPPTQCQRIGANDLRKGKGKGEHSPATPQGVATSMSPMGLYVRIKINGKDCVGLIDTGASFSILNKNLVGDINVKDELQMFVAGGKTMKTMGSVKVPIAIGEKMCLHVFQVVPSVVSTANCIIGLDLINALNIDVITSKGKFPIFLLDGNVLNLLQASEIHPVDVSMVDKKQTLLGRITENIVLQKNCISTVEIKLNLNIPNNTLLMVKPFKNVEGLMSEGVTEVIDNLVHVPIFNVLNTEFV